MIQFRNQQEKLLNQKIMERMETFYDKKEKMMTLYRGANGYHSRLKNQWVHPTRDSLIYAYELMNRGENGDFEVAVEILKRVVPLQNTNPVDKTYGIWSYYMEEPLDQMSPPDWNWADFCGKVLIQVLMDHGNRLENSLKDMLRRAVIHSCNSIIRRDMGPHYTNISIMGTLVTMAAGEIFKLEEFISYAKKRLDILYNFNIGHGAFQEYNSPSYTWIVIDDLAALTPYIKDKEALEKFQELNNLAWKCIAEHYHYQTKQWAGPHARFYAMLEDEELQMRIQRALDYRITLIPLDTEGLADKLPMGFFSVKSVCPDCYVRYFTEPTKNASVDGVFTWGNELKDREIAVCRQTESCNLGTFYKSTFWNQRRNHISYFGTAEEPIYCDLKCLHDFYDYSSGLIVTAQEGLRTVSAVGFCTDGGDTHCSLDMIKDGFIEASDLRIRFEIGGAVKNVEIEEKKEGLYIVNTGREWIRIEFLNAVFGDASVEFAIIEEKDHVNETGVHKTSGTILGIDAVFYHGERRRIDFRELSACCCGIAFEIIPENETFAGGVNAGVTDGTLWVEQEQLKVTAPAAACTMANFNREARAYRYDKEYLELYCGQ